MWHLHDGGDWAWMTVTMAFVWVPIILAIVWAIGRGASPARRDDLSGDAREVARRSYARGDISSERFHEIIEDLDRTERPSGA